MRLATFHSLWVFILVSTTTASSHHELTTRDGDDVLRDGTAESVGMLSRPLDEMIANLTAYTNYSRFSNYEIHPIEPGGTVIVGHERTIVSAFAFGYRSLYASANGTKLAPAQQEKTSLDTIYDLASLTKLFTTVTTLRFIEYGLISLHESVATYVPEFAANGKEGVTIEMLLTHTSGMIPDPIPSLFSGKYPTYQDKVQAITNQTLKTAPGTAYAYADLSFMTLQVILERVTGHPLDHLVAEFTTSLGMTLTFFNRGNAKRCSTYSRTAPTEFQSVTGPPVRPQPVRGMVHDENAWALDGVAGHAGIFSTARDMAIFCQMLLNNGTYGGFQVLSQDSVDLIFTDLNAWLGSIGSSHGAGFELNQYYTAGPMNTTQTASHTGFTGTSIVVDRGRNAFWVHLSNRVHPTRAWSSNNIVRQAIGYWVGKSLGLNVDFPKLS